MIVPMKPNEVVQRVDRKFGVPLICDDAHIGELVRGRRSPDSEARSIDGSLDQRFLSVRSHRARVSALRSLEKVIMRWMLHAVAM
jgi:type VI secretion system protein VasG